MQFVFINVALIYSSSIDELVQQMGFVHSTGAQCPFSHYIFSKVQVHMPFRCWNSDVSESNRVNDEGWNNPFLSKLVIHIWKCSIENESNINIKNCNFMHLQTNQMKWISVHEIEMESLVFENGLDNKIDYMFTNWLFC